MDTLADHLRKLDDQRIAQIINELETREAHDSVIALYVYELDRRWREMLLQHVTCFEDIEHIAGEQHPLNHESADYNYIEPPDYTLDSEGDEIPF